MAVANMVESVLGGRGERPGGNSQFASGAAGGGLPAAVHTRAGTGEHRVHDATVRAGGRGGPAGLGPRGRGRDRCRPGGPGEVRQRAGGLPRGGGEGLSGRDRGGLRAGGLPAGTLLRGLRPAAGAGPPDRHPAGGQRRRLRPGGRQRPATAGLERLNKRGRAARPGHLAARREAGRGDARRAAFPAAGRLRIRRSGHLCGRPGHGGAGRDPGCLRRVRRRRAGLRGGHRVRGPPLPPCGPSAASGPASCDGDG